MDNNLVDIDVFNLPTDISYDEILKIQNGINDTCLTHFIMTFEGGNKIFSNLRISHKKYVSQTIDILIHENKYVLRLFNNNTLLCMCDTYDHLMKVIETTIDGSTNIKKEI